MKLSVLQWNILFSEDIKNIKEFLLKNKADIISLQELSLDSPIQKRIDTPAYIGKALGYNFHFCKIPVYGNKQLKYLANGIFTRFPIVDKKVTWIQENPSHSSYYSKQYRGYAEVALRIGTKVLTVGTTHTSYTFRFIQTPRKKREAAELAKLVKDKKKPFILSGDLNSRPDSYTIKLLEKYLKHAGPSKDQNTFTTKPFVYQGFRESGLNWRLDYIFTSNDVKVLTSGILKTKYSDHLPVYAEMEI